MSVTSSLRWIVLLSLVIVSFSESSRTTQSPKFIETFGIDVEYAPPPLTLKGMAAVSDGIVVGRISKSSTKESYTPGATRHELLTDYSVNIVEVLKAHPQLATVGADVTVERRGGQIDEGDRIVRSVEEGFPAFATGETYLLFLRLNPITFAFEVRSGPHGAYRISNGVVTPLGRSELADGQNGKRSDAILAELRSVLLQ